MNTITIIGLQWGDEGKGKIVDRLAAEATHVARYQGGHNAGHTLQIDGKKTVLHLLPSGVMHAQTHCYIGSGVVVSLPDLLTEITTVTNSGISLQGRLFVADNATLILPYHIRLDQARDKAAKIGTTQRGIGPAHEDKVARRALRIYDLYNGDGEKKLAANVEYYNRLLVDDKSPLVATELWQALTEQAQALKPYLCDDIGERLAQAAKAGEIVLLEGAQGTMLDIEQGTYPFTTSASCLAAAAAGGLGVQLATETLGVTKTYCTRVGNGPFPTELHDADGAFLARRGNEFGATTGRARRCGWLDIPLLRHTLRLNGCRRLIVTKMDVLDECEHIKLCVEYRLDGKRRSLPPSDPAQLARCEPVYETLPGWREHPTLNVTDDAALPPAAMRYLRRIEELSDCKIDIISTGPERDATIIRNAPF